MMQGIALYAPGAPAGSRPTRRRAAHALFYATQTPQGLPGAVCTSALKAAHIGDDAAQCWVHLAMFGTWEDHPAGAFTFDADVFAQIIRNFDAQAKPVNWTYGHPDGDEPAPGWVRQLAVKGDGTGEYDGLYALTEWTEKTAQEIREGGWRFCSVFVDFASRDRKTKAEIGCELIQVGLTNNPFLDGQKPIALSRFGASETSMNDRKLKKQGPAEVAQEQLDAIAAELGMDSADPDKIKARVDALVALVAAMTDPPAPGGDAPPADAAAMSALPEVARAKWLAKVVALGKALKVVKLDGPTEAPAPVDAAPDADEAAEGALLQKLLDILAKAGISDPAAQSAALDANADAIASLLSAGGVPMTDENMPMPMARKFASLKVELDAARARDKALTAQVAALESAEAERKETARKLDDARKAAEAETAAQTAEREAAAKAAALKTEADTLIAGAIADGRLLLAVAIDRDGRLTKIEAGSEVEHARKHFALDHDAAKAWLLSKPRLVPVSGSLTGSHPVPPPLVVKPEEAIDGVDLNALTDETERMLARMNHGNPVFARHVIALHREKVAAAVAAAAE